MNNRTLMMLAILFLLPFTGCSDSEWKQENVGYLGKAKANPVLAGYRFLSVIYSEVSVLPGMVSLPPDGGVIVVSQHALPKSEKYVREMKHWINQGGHLILVKGDFKDYQNEYLDSLSGNASYQRDKSKPYFGFKEEEDEEKEVIVPLFEQLLGEYGFKFSDTDKMDASKVVIHYHDVTDGAYDVELEIGDHQFITQSGKRRMRGFVTVGVDDQYVIASKKVDYGRITFVSDGQWMTNPYIGNGDHAQILYELVDIETKDEDRGEHVYIVYANQGSFFELLWAQAWGLVISLFVLTGFWVWGASNRLGKPHEKRSSELRDFTEHIRVSGEFYWTNRLTRELLGSIRQRILHDSGVLHFSKQSTESERNQTITYLSERTGLPSNEIEGAMFTYQTEDPDQFIEIVKILQKLEQQL